MERRANARKIEVREDGDKKGISGYAAVFYRKDDPGTEFQLFRGLTERIMPGAFDRALKEKQNVAGLFNHDDSKLLGRVASGTLRLSVDNVGLRYDIDVADTSDGRDLLELISRGDVTGSSFSFRVKSETFRDSEGDGDEIREVNDVDLFDVGPVVFPAYEATTAGLRSVNGVDDARKALNECHRKRRQEKMDRRWRQINMDRRLAEIS